MAENQSENPILVQLKQFFSGMPNDIHLILFAEPDGNEAPFVEATRQVVKAFRELTKRISFKEFRIQHREAKKYGITETPTLLIAPESYAIRWLGAPIGEEAKTFLQMLYLVGSGKSQLSEQSRKVLRKMEGERKIKVFMSPSCPYCPQQAMHALRAAVELPGQVSVELIDIQCKPELAQQYEAFSVPQTYANEILIGKGAQSEEVFALSLSKLEPQSLFIPDIEDPEIQADLLIVGGGPAGLTAAIYAVRSGLKTVLVEKGLLGGQVATTPVVENYPGFTHVGGKVLVDMMVSHALEYVQIFQGEEVLDVRRGAVFEVKTNRRRFLAKAILLATGAKHKKLGVPGEDRLAGHGISYCSTCDGPLFKGKSVLMVGGGNSAVTEALYLKHVGASVTLIHRRERLRAQEFLISQLQHAEIPIRYNSAVSEIHGEARVEAVSLYNIETGQTTRLETDGVFIAIGYAPSVELAKTIGVALDADGFIQRDFRHRTSVPGIYSAGDVEGGYKQIVTAAGQGAEAAMAIFEDMLSVKG
jgi:thioredoxin reductase (NADPH)